MPIGSEIVSSLGLLSWVLAQVLAQSLSPENFVLSRPGVPPAGAPVYRKAAGERPSGADPFSCQLGFTLWRLRPSDNSPERVAFDTPLDPGDRIGLSLESPKRGYLYVIDREEYADGGLGDTFLIFPTMRTRGGDNEVTPARPIEIPPSEDRPNYLTVHKIKPGHVGEMLTLIVTPEPIVEFATGPNALHLDEKMVARWEGQWAQAVETFELVGGAGRLRTDAEKNAALPGGARLHASDPAPETVFQTTAPPGAPVLIKLRLHYAP